MTREPRRLDRGSLLFLAVRRFDRHRNRLETPGWLHADIELSRARVPTRWDSQRHPIFPFSNHPEDRANGSSSRRILQEARHSRREGLVSWYLRSCPVCLGDVQDDVEFQGWVTCVICERSFRKDELATPTRHGDHVFGAVPLASQLLRQASESPKAA
jgi:hypothetical protein